MGYAPRVAGERVAAGARHVCAAHGDGTRAQEPTCCPRPAPGFGICVPVPGLACGRARVVRRVALQHGVGGAPHLSHVPDTDPVRIHTAAPSGATVSPVRRRKTLFMDQRRIDRARALLHTDTETETIDRALALVEDFAA